jgi:enoyl-[acyl-carrier protein] reductase I
MAIMKNKKGLIMGVANERSIAWGIARKLSEEGAQLAFSYQNEGFKRRLIPLMEKNVMSVMFQKMITIKALLKTL